MQSGGRALDHVRQTIELITSAPLPEGPHPDALGEILRVVRGAARDATRMAVEGRSRIRGRRPSWLDQAADIRLADMSFKPEKTVVQFSLPELRDAAPELFDQRELWETGPAPNLTALDCLGLAVDEIASSNTDSSGFDAGLLMDVAKFGRGLNGTYSSVRLARHGTAGAPGVVDVRVVERAEQLRRQTPDPRPVRVVGRVDMIRASTEAFSLILDDGTEVRGTLAAESLGIDDLRRFFHRRVLVHASAVYRASGRLLRLDAEAIEDGHGAPELWSRLPEPIRPGVASGPVSSGARARQGVAVFFGTWPGEETEEELLEALAELG